MTSRCNLGLVLLWIGLQINKIEVFYITIHKVSFIFWGPFKFRGPVQSHRSHAPAMRPGEGEVGIDGRGRTASKSSSAGAAEESGAANRAWRAANQDRGTVNRAWGLPACELGDRVYQARSGSRRNQELQDDPRGDVDESRGSAAVPARGSGMEERGRRCRPGTDGPDCGHGARSRGGGGGADE